MRSPRGARGRHVRHPSAAASSAEASRTDRPTARVVALHRGWVDVLHDGREERAVYAGAMRGKQLVVGDRVLLRPARHDQDLSRIVDVLPRQRVLLRTADDTMAEERPLVANADLAVPVLAADDLEQEIRLLDRILVAASAGGLDALICINKIDLARGSREIEERYQRLGYRLVRTSAATGEGVEELRGHLSGRWTVLAGHSGVGKSSLTNRIVPDAGRPVGATGRFGGRHTTTSPRALRVPGSDDAWLVDTPGIRSFGIAHVPPDELAPHFPELRDLPCALDGCRHAGEADCVVPARLGTAITPERYATYRRFLLALEEGDAAR